MHVEMNTATTHSRLWWYSTAILCLAHFGQSTCFYPNGTEASGFIPIDGDAEVSACCSPYDLFTNLGLCKSPFDGGNNWYWRNSCTDQSWNSTSCPQYCVDTQVDPRYISSNWPLIACSETTFCCAYNAGDVESTDEACCSDDSRVLDIGPAKRVGGKIESTSLFPATATTTIFTSGSSSPATSTITSNTDSTVSSAGVAGASTTIKSAGSSTPSPASGLSTEAKAGIGVGVTVGILVTIGLIAYFLLRRHPQGRGQSAQQRHEGSDSQSGWVWLADSKNLPTEHNDGVNHNGESDRVMPGGYHVPHQNNPSANLGNYGYASELDTERAPVEVPTQNAVYTRGELPA